jgi:peptide-methionine (S)-S-oxide reductase
MYPEAMIRGKVGFMGVAGAKPNPTYKEVCSGETGHVEVYDFTYKGGAEMYRELVKFMFQMHDPTLLNQQGNDKGPQYASVIFAYDSAQRVIAQEVISELQSLLDAGLLSCYKSNVVTTVIHDATEFFPAHDEHQEYLAKNPNGYCNHRIRFKEWPTVPNLAGESSL